MMVKDLAANQPVDEIELSIEELSDVRTYLTKWGDDGRVRDAVGKDGQGDTVKITLWNDDVDKVEQGATVLIKNGYAKIWNGELQVSSGRYGSLTIS